MSIRSHPEADGELTAAFEYYEKRVRGLGHDFLDEFEHGIAQIQRNPEAYSILRKTTRRYLLRRFPYGLVYQIRSDGLYLIAVMHLKRRPFYWQSRLAKD